MLCIKNVSLCLLWDRIYNDWETVFKPSNYPINPKENAIENAQESYRNAFEVYLAYYKPSS